jgi:hypothetical protein
LQQHPGDVISERLLLKTVGFVDTMNEVVPAGEKASDVDVLALEVGRIVVAVADRDPLAYGEPVRLKESAVRLEDGVAVSTRQADPEVSVTEAESALHVSANDLMIPVSA